MPDALPPFPETDEALARQLARAGLTGDPLGYGIAMVVRAAREAKGGARGLSPEGERALAEKVAALCRAETAAAARASLGAARWVAAGVVAAAALAAGGAGYAAGRHALAAEVRLAEQGLALPLRAAAGFREIVRHNPDGCARLRARAVEGGGEVTDYACWTRWPAPAAGKR